MRIIFATVAALAGKPCGQQAFAGSADVCSVRARAACLLPMLSRMAGPQPWLASYLAVNCFTNHLFQAVGGGFFVFYVVGLWITRNLPVGLECFGARGWVLLGARLVSGTYCCLF